MSWIMALVLRLALVTLVWLVVSILADGPLQPRLLFALAGWIFVVEVLADALGIRRVTWSLRDVPAAVIIPLQLVTYGLFRLVCPLLGYTTRRVSEHALADLDGKVVVAANHWGWGDTFVALSALPLWLFGRLAPFRFIAKDAYVEQFWKKLILFPMGAIPAQHDGNDKALKAAVGLMARGHTIFIFPEGKISWSGDRLPAKVGVAYLANNADAWVLPIGMKKRRRGVVTTVGEPMRLKQAANLLPEAERVVEEIHRLASP